MNFPLRFQLPVAEHVAGHRHSSHSSAELPQQAARRWHGGAPPSSPTFLYGQAAPPENNLIGEPP